MSTHIAWTDETWNPVTGCTKVSQGCKHCYAETIANRMWAKQYVPNADGTSRRFTDVRCHSDRLEKPLHWRTPRRVFVNSMSDLFHPDVPDEFIQSVFVVMEKTPQHTYQVLTKRPLRMMNFARDWTELPDDAPERFGPAPNIWLGVSVENQAAADERIPLLLQTPAAVRFLSCEPLLGPIQLADACNDCLEDGIHWVIIGGESGPHFRPMNTAWAEHILYQCQDAQVACFVKQMGGTHPGTEMQDLPPALRVREYPQGVAA